VLLKRLQTVSIGTHQSNEDEKIGPLNEIGAQNIFDFLFYFFLSQESLISIYP